MTAQRPKTPRFILTRDRNTLGEYKVADKKILIGRSEFADILIEDRFASKVHAMILVYSDGLVLIDLNSANGVTVNSQKVKCVVLRDDDIIQIGHHRLKVVDAPPLSDEMREVLESKDTVKMKNINDVQKLREAARKLEAISKQETGSQ